MCARSAPFSFEIVAKGFSLHYFSSHAWIWWFFDLSYKSVLLSNATVPRGFLSLPMLSQCANLGIARGAPPCTSGSANDRRRTRVIAMLRQGIGTSRKISMHAWNFLPMFRRQIPSAIYRRTAPSSRRTFGDVHQGQKCPRHIGDTSAAHRRCSCKHRRCIFDVITSPMVWWSIADPSPMFPSCLAKHRRCYGDDSLSVRNLPSDWSPMITWAPL